jgi:hypothetical protein
MTPPPVRGALGVIGLSGRVCIVSGIDNSAACKSRMFPCCLIEEQSLEI